MPCYKPLLGFLVESEEGRTVSLRFNPKAKSVTLPCGKCYGCVKERARQWAVRLQHEAQLHEDNAFITLTYDDEHLPKDRSLSVRHCQEFLKRFRARIAPVRIKFFLAGEYGDENERPHYHAIIFGWAPPELSARQGVAVSRLSVSELLTEVWGQGFTSVGSVAPASVAYVSQYALKKVGKTPESYGGRKPEFVLMSRGGRNGHGIGYGWIEKFRGDVYPSDEVIVGGVPCRPPRYYDKYLESQDSELLARLKAKREREAAVLEAATTPAGDEVMFPANFNPQRLRVKETVARARDGLRRRGL